MLLFPGTILGTVENAVEVQPFTKKDPGFAKKKNVQGLIWLEWEKR